MTSAATVASCSRWLRCRCQRVANLSRDAVWQARRQAPPEAGSILRYLQRAVSSVEPATADSPLFAGAAKVQTRTHAEDPSRHQNYSEVLPSSPRAAAAVAAGDEGRSASVRKELFPEMTAPMRDDATPSGVSRGRDGNQTNGSSGGDGGHLSHSRRSAAIEDSGNGQPATVPAARVSLHPPQPATRNGLSPSLPIDLITPAQVRAPAGLSADTSSGDEQNMAMPTCPSLSPLTEAGVIMMHTPSAQATPAASVCDLTRTD